MLFSVRKFYNMLKTPHDLFTKLLCNDCKQVISCGPVKIKDNIGFCCGRCLKPECNNMRNTLFEDVAVYLTFPCQYEKFGCKYELKWNKSIDHEKKCIYRNGKLLSCPILPETECSYQGPRHEVLTHCTSSHADLIVNSPYIINPCTTWNVEELKKLKNLKKSSFKNIFATAHGFLFKIHFKLFFARDEMSLYVSLLGDLKLAIQFEFHVEVKHRDPTKGHLIFVKQVTDRNGGFGKKYAISTQLNSKVCINIKRNKTKCLNCKKEFSNIKNNELTNCCEKMNLVRNEIFEATRMLQRCSSSIYGCKYIDIPSNIDKHDNYFCKYSKDVDCKECKFVPFNEKKKPIEHMKENHFKNRYFGYSFEILGIFFLFKAEEALLISEKGNFFFHWRLRPSIDVLNILLDIVLTQPKISFSIICITNILTSDEKNLKIKIKLNCLTAREQHIGYLLYSKDHWELDFQLPSYILDKNCYYLSLEVE